MADALAGVVIGLTMRREIWQHFQVPTSQIPARLFEVKNKNSVNAHQEDQSYMNRVRTQRGVVPMEAEFVKHLALRFLDQSGAFPGHAGVRSNPLRIEGDTIRVDDPPEDVVALASTLAADDVPEADETWAVQFETSSGLEDARVSGHGGCRRRTLARRPAQARLFDAGGLEPRQDHRRRPSHVAGAGAPARHGAARTQAHERLKTWSQP